MNLSYTLYDVTVTTVTPLHIGTGADLLLNFDYVLHDKRTWRIDENSLLESKAEGDHNAYEKILQNRPPAELLDERTDFTPDQPWFRYVLSGQPRAKSTGAQLREQIKDAYDHPYLPGSSLKGALRTALAWHGWEALRLRPQKASLGRSPKWAAQQIEHDIFGPDPNHDLMRALQVSDSDPLGVDSLMLVNAKVITPGSEGSPIEVEAIRPDTAFHLTMKLDEALFTPWAERRGVHFRDRADWLRHLAQIVHTHSLDRARRELAWFTKRTGAERSRDLYKTLAQARVAEGSFLLQLGWGSGWDGKTLGSRLSANGEFMEGIIQDYRLDRASRGKRRPHDPFPKSRRITVGLAKSQSGQVREILTLPLGWVLVEMKAMT